MSDLKLNEFGDLEISKMSADPVVIPERIIEGCSNILLENGDELIFEDDNEGPGFLCLEFSSGEDVVIPSEIIGYPAFYDLVINRNTLTLRLKRALQTPLGYISIYVLGDGGVDIVDDLYGNAIYRELSEGLTLNFIARARRHTINAIERAGLTQSVDSVQVSVLDTHTVQIYITYTNTNEPTIIPITF